MIINKDNVRDYVKEKMSENIYYSHRSLFKDIHFGRRNMKPTQSRKEIMEILNIAKETREEVLICRYKPLIDQLINLNLNIEVCEVSVLYNLQMNIKYSIYDLKDTQQEILIELVDKCCEESIDKNVIKGYVKRINEHKEYFIRVVHKDYKAIDRSVRGIELKLATDKLVQSVIDDNKTSFVETDNYRITIELKNNKGEINYEKC